MKEKLCQYLHRINPFNLDSAVDMVMYDFHEVKQHINNMRKSLDDIAQVNEKIEQAKKDVEFFCLSLDSFGDATQMMMWIKDIQGKYIWANEKIRNELLHSGKLSSTIGLTDIELAARHKGMKANMLHTAGETCIGSDYATIEMDTPSRFIEHFIIDGQDMILEIFKNTIRGSKNDEIIGTVGIGRNITEDYRELKAIGEESTCKDTKERIAEYLNKYKFEEKSNKCKDTDCDKNCGDCGVI